MADETTTTGPVQSLAKVEAKAKSWVEKFVERASGEIKKAEPPGGAMIYVKEAGGLAADYGVGGLTAALLGAAHARFGLDTRAGATDGWVAGLGALATVGLAGSHPIMAAQARRVGNTAWNTFIFRKTCELMGNPIGGGGGHSGQGGYAPSPRRSTMHGEDPIVNAAKGL